MIAVPLRVRLTAWYSLALVVALGGFGAATHAVVRHELLHHHDDSLVRTAAAVQRVIAQHEDCANLTPAQVEQLDAIGRLVLLHDVEGQGLVFYRSPDTAAFPVPFPLEVDPALLRRPAWFDTRRLADGTLVRVLSLPYVSRAGRAGLIRVMDPLGDVDEPLRGLRRALLLMTPLALATAISCGWLLAGRALRPVDLVTRRTREIEAGALDRRLPEPPVRDEVGRLVDTLNDMMERLERSFAGMRRFTADASHEMRTPLAALRGTVDLALSQARSDEEYREALASVGEEVDRLRGIVDDLLVLARADAGRLELRREPVDLGRLAGEVVDALRPVAEERGVRLDADATEAALAGDPRWLRQMLFNLVANAIDHASSVVRVRVRRAGGGEDSVSVVVCDDGPGFAAESIPRVFERFYRADAARGRSGGAGLGLAIASEIAAAHGGTIVAANLPADAGGGAELTVRLPAVR